MNDYTAYTEEKDRKIEFSQVFLYFWDHIVLILVISLLTTLAACGYIVFDHISKSSQSVTFNNILKQNKLSVYPESDKSDKVLSTEEDVIDRSCIVKSVVSVEYSNYAKENLKDMISRYQKEAVSVLKSGKTLASIAKEVNSNDYSDKGVKNISADNIKWMINTSFSGTNTLSFSVTDISVDRASDIASMLSEAFVKNTQPNEAFQSSKIVDTASVFYDGTGKSASFDINRLVKFVIIGFFGGFIVVVIILLAVYLISDKVRTSSDIEYLDFKSIARIPKVKEKQKVEYKRFACTVALKKDIKKLLIVPADNKTKLDGILENAGNILSDLNCGTELIAARDLYTSADALMDSQNADAVVIVATYGVTSMKQLEFTKKEIEKTGREVFGVALDLCKH